MHLRELDTNLIVVLDALLMDASVTKAAKRLGRSPSAISHALSNMREIFGDPLFVRAGQRLVPTSRADELAPTVHAIVSGIESLLRPRALFDPKTHERDFAVACSETCELGVLHRLRGMIRNEAPGITIRRRPLNGAHGLEELRAGRAQFVILHGEPGEEAADFVWRKLYDEPFVTVVRPGHPLAGRKPSKKAFAGTEHILVSPPEGGSDPVREHFEHHGLRIENPVEASSVFVALFLALDSDALVTVPKSVADAVAAHNSFAQVRQPVAPLQVSNYLGWHRSQDRDECHEWLREQFLRAAPGEDKESLKSRGKT
jgi:DNA-binding transcriptional LysR family regulator